MHTEKNQRAQFVVGGSRSNAGISRSGDGVVSCELLKYVSDNIKYPKTALENGIQGRVIVCYIVEKDGSIGDAEEDFQMLLFCYV